MARQATSYLRVLVFGLCALAAGRAGQAGVAVSPLKQDVSVRPGETGKVVVTIFCDAGERYLTTQVFQSEGI